MSIRRRTLAGAVVTTAPVGALLALLVMIAAVFGAASPARAHGGPYTLTISTDGAGGLAVMGEYDEDSHIVEEIIDPVVTATSTDGGSVGPVALVSSSEGVGRWVTEEPILQPGTWTVTVVTTTPEAASTTVEIEVAELAPPIAPSTAAEEAGTDADDAAAASAAGGAGAVPPWIVVVAAVAVGLGVVGVLVVWRRRSARAG